jgi:ABC-type multidrug transport system fused ATPase/permease subunit
MAEHADVELLVDRHTVTRVPRAVTPATKTGHSALPLNAPSLNATQGAVIPPPTKIEPVAEAMAPGGTDTRKEKVFVGKVKREVYLAYMKSGGGVCSLVLLFCGLTFSTGSKAGADFWVSVWSDPGVVTDGITPLIGSTVYGGFAVLICVSTFMNTWQFYHFGLRASSNLHEQLLTGVSRARFAFFDVTPRGRILNRFTSDMNYVDDSVADSIYQLAQQSATVVVTMVIIGYATWPFLLVAAILSVAYRWIFTFFIVSSRQIKRLSSMLYSPVVAHFAETLVGVSSIRAFRMQPTFTDALFQKMEMHTRANYSTMVTNMWLAVRLQLMASLIVFSAALFVVLSRDTIDPGIAGLSISYAMQITRTLEFLVQNSTDVEVSVVAVERILEYAHVKSEPPERTDGLSRTDGCVQKANWNAKKWPSNGDICFKGVMMRYRPHLPWVLKGLNLHIRPREKVGIVGRTGAGKSSLLLLLLRVVDPENGTVTIDGLDLREIGVVDLRSRLSVIPQDPTMFLGSIRFNLDPLDFYTDAELWEALRTSHLNDHVRSLPKGLDHAIEEGGKNFSVGERQLLCLARALLRHSQILLLDEATSSVDSNTDQLVTSTVELQFVDSTVIVVAHRLSTVMNLDRIVVMGNGVVQEDGPPSELASSASSLFHGLAKASTYGAEHFTAK